MLTPFPLLPISLIVPAYHAETYLHHALQSVAAQSRRPAEVIVVDDGSRDRTAAVAEAYGARILRLPRNGGPSAARNAGLTVAREAWVAFLDADDVWSVEKLAAQWDALSQWPDAGFCFTDYDVVETAGRTRCNEMAADAGYLLAEPSARQGSAARFERGALARGLVRSMFIRQSSVVIAAELMRTCGGYDERLRLSEDYDLFLRVVAEAPGIAIERPLVTYHRRPSSLSGDPIAEVDSIDRLWAGVLERPERYPATVVQLIGEQRAATLRAGCRLGLRLGRFAEARSFGRKALRGDRAFVAVGLLILAKALDNNLGQSLYRFARSLWRSRPHVVPALRHERQPSR